MLWLLHVRSRWFVGAEWYKLRSAVYDISQTQVGQEHESELEKSKQFEYDVKDTRWSRSDILSASRVQSRSARSIECGVLRA